MNEREVRTLSVAIVPDGKPIFDEGVFEIEICDEGAGEFLKVSEWSSDNSAIRINPEEWPLLRDTIEKMILECRA